MKKYKLIIVFLVAIIAVGIIQISRHPKTASTDNQPAATTTPTQNSTPGISVSPISIAPTPVLSERTDIIDIDLFKYDQDAPLDVTDVLVEQSDEDITVHRITFKGGGNCRAVALLVVPSTQGAYPTLIYLHKDLGHGEAFKFNGNKEQFLDEALLLAHHGVVSLLLDSPFLNGCGDVHDQRQGYIRQVIDVRRGIDILEQNMDVDASRIGFVGHNYGATWGGVIAGVEPRIKAYVLMGGSPFVGKSCCHITNHIAVSYDMEPYRYIGQADSTPILFMAAKQDEFFNAESTWLYYNSANPPKSIIWYDSNNYELQEAGMQDRLMWLSEQLGFDY